MIDKHFLVYFVGDESSSESNSVYYSFLVRAKTKQEALEKYVLGEENSWSTKDINDFDALEITNKNYIN